MTFLAPLGYSSSVASIALAFGLGLTPSAHVQMGQLFLSCSTLQDGGVDSHSTDVFQAALKTRLAGNMRDAVDGGVDRLSLKPILVHFYTYLTPDYKFSPGSVACAVKPAKRRQK